MNTESKICARDETWQAKKYRFNMAGKELEECIAAKLRTKDFNLN